MREEEASVPGTRPSPLWRVPSERPVAKEIPYGSTLGVHHTAHMLLWEGRGRDFALHKGQAILKIQQLPHVDWEISTLKNVSVFYFMLLNFRHWEYRHKLKMYPQENTCLKNSVVNAPPSIAMSPSILFWFAFFRMFSSTVRSHTSLGLEYTCKEWHILYQNHSHCKYPQLLLLRVRP